MKKSGTINKRTARLIAACGIFILLTAVKLVVPEQAERVSAAVSRDADYMGFFESVGETVGTFARRLRNVEEPEEETEVPAPARVFLPSPLAAVREEAESVVPEGAVVPEEVPEAVAAFLEAQARFADLGLPAGVTYDVPEPPFEYASPVAGYTSSGFGFREHPIENCVKFHYGTDFAAWSGTNVLAFADGTVRLFGWDAGYGNYVIIDHADGWSTLYAHCSTVYVTGGDEVKMGNLIALVGQTGEVTGPHLHFELRKDGEYYNPEFILS